MLPRSITEGVCHVCGEDAEYDGNHLLQCDACGVFVHTDCYSVQHRPDGRLWLCDVCRLGLDVQPPCALCPVVGGALKPTDCGRWVHSACALWVPETCPLEEAADAAAQRAVGIAGTVSGLHRVPRARKALLCSLCKQPHGACVQCAGSRKCLVAFHPLCARGAGYTVEWREEDKAGPLAGSPSWVVSPGGKGSGMMGRGGRDCTHAGHAGLSHAVKRRHGGDGRHQEGTCTADGIRMLLFCPKHAPSQDSQGAAVVACQPTAVPDPADCARTMAPAAAHALARQHHVGMPYVMGRRPRNPSMLPASRVVGAMPRPTMQRSVRSLWLCVLRSRRVKYAVYLPPTSPAPGGVDF